MKKTALFEGADSANQRKYQGTAKLSFFLYWKDLPLLLIIDL